MSGGQRLESSFPGLSTLERCGATTQRNRTRPACSSSSYIHSCFSFSLFFHAALEPAEALLPAPVQESSVPGSGYFAIFRVPMYSVFTWEKTEIQERIFRYGRLARMGGPGTARGSGAVGSLIGRQDLGPTTRRFLGQRQLKWHLGPSATPSLRKRHPGRRLAGQARHQARRLGKRRLSTPQQISAATAQREQERTTQAVSLRCQLPEPSFGVWLLTHHRLQPWHTACRRERRDSRIALPALEGFCATLLADEWSWECAHAVRLRLKQNICCESPHFSLHLHFCISLTLWLHTAMRRTAGISSAQLPASQPKNTPLVNRNSQISILLSLASVAPNQRSTVPRVHSAQSSVVFRFALPACCA